MRYSGSDCDVLMNLPFGPVIVNRPRLARGSVETTDVGVTMDGPTPRGGRLSFKSVAWKTIGFRQWWLLGERGGDCAAKTPSPRADGLAHRGASRSLIDQRSWKEIALDDDVTDLGVKV